MGLSNLLSKRSLLGTVDVPKGGEVPLAVIDLSYEGEGANNELHLSDLYNSFGIFSNSLP